MLCLYEAGTFFIPSRQSGIPLEIDEIPAKAGLKSSSNALFRDDFETALSCDRK